MIQHVPFSSRLAAELAHRERKDAAKRQERSAQSLLRSARPIVENRMVSVLYPVEANDGRTWVKVPERRDVLLS